MAGLRKDQIDVLLSEGAFGGLKKLKERGAITKDKRAAERHPVLDDPTLFKGYVDR